MSRLLASAALLALVMLGCMGHQRLEQVSRLSDRGRGLYSKYKQFMTEDQQDEFLNLTNDEDRQSYVAGLKIEQRLARYPKSIQDAIWSEEVVPGMDSGAVLLTWGVPDSRDWDEEQRARGNDVERWSYRRHEENVQVVMTNGVVTNLERSRRKP